MGQLGMPDRFNCRHRLFQPVGNHHRTIRRRLHRGTAGRQECKGSFKIGHGGTDRLFSRNGVQGGGLRIFCMVLCESIGIRPCRYEILIISPLNKCKGEVNSLLKK